MEKLHSAESIRGLACIAVVFSHLLGTFYPQLHSFYESKLPKFAFAESIYNSPFAFLYSGTGAVFIFFVLSGYVLTLSSLKTTDYLKRFKISIVKRYPRLAIPALFSCLLMYLCLQVNVDVSKTAEAIQIVKIQPNLFDAIYNGTVGAFATGDQRYNRALWTMRIELIGSFIIYIACLLQYKPALRHLFLLIIAIVSIKIPEQIQLGFYSFIIGHYFYFFRNKIPEVLSILIFILGLYFCGAHNNSASYSLFSSYLDEKTYEYLNFLGGILVVFAVLKSKIIDKILDKKPLIWLGKVSFAIYLVHLSLIYIICIPIFNYLLGHNFTFVSASLVSCAITFICVLIFSSYYSKYIDDLSIYFSNKLAKILIK
ncbi:acyltransferase [Acinetobacter baumannii]|uniref:acyltransferase family protein n=2 Tax=Acinetobacter baumannii TaxID=470 RepID=UPI001EF006B8|nr:acyltransferase [Acinetobacter baumannii]MCG6602164.1 acyltransferase family protein [Acinetobacter baumannii]